MHIRCSSRQACRIRPAWKTGGGASYSTTRDLMRFARAYTTTLLTKEERAAWDTEDENTTLLERNVMDPVERASTWRARLRAGDQNLLVVEDPHGTVVGIAYASADRDASGNGELWLINLAPEA